MASGSKQINEPTLPAANGFYADAFLFHKTLPELEQAVGSFFTNAAFICEILKTKEIEKSDLFYQKARETAIQDIELMKRTNDADRTVIERRVYFRQGQEPVWRTILSKQKPEADQTSKIKLPSWTTSYMSGTIETDLGVKHDNRWTLFEGEEGVEIIESYDPKKPATTNMKNADRLTIIEKDTTWGRKLWIPIYENTFRMLHPYDHVIIRVTRDVGLRPTPPNPNTQAYNLSLRLNISYDPNIWHGPALELFKKTQYKAIEGFLKPSFKNRTYEENAHWLEPLRMCLPSTKN